MKTKHEQQRINRLNLLKEAYEKSKGGKEFFNSSELAKQFHVGNDFITCCSRNGLFKSVTGVGSTYDSTVMPNIKTVDEIIKLEKSIVMFKNGKYNKNGVKYVDKLKPITDGKICKMCGFFKPFSDYGTQSSTPDGKRNYCRKCISKYNIEYYKTKKSSMSKTPVFKQKSDVGLIRRFLRWIY